MKQDDSLACHRCFKDKSLIDFIRKQGKRGWCDWCGGRNVYIVPLYELGEIFREAVTIYQPGAWDDESISFLLQEDWQVFSGKIEQAPNDLMQELATAILMARIDQKDYFADYPDFTGGFKREDAWLVEHWHEMAENFYEHGNKQIGKHQDPFFKDIPDQLEVAFEDLLNIYEPDKILYRARIHKDRFRTQRFTLAGLGAPPQDRTPAGRANRKNEPVLYLASDDSTALSEVRAWKGSAVATATVKIKNRISIVSLLKYEIPKSPFFDDLLRWKIQLGQLFQRLAYELSIPVGPHESDEMYFSTQYLCDWVRKAGYDGIEYPSAMGKGFNVVLFNPDNAEVSEIKYVRVKGIQHDFQTLCDTDPIYEEGPFDYLLKSNAG